MLNDQTVCIFLKIKLNFLTDSLSFRSHMFWRSLNWTLQNFRAIPLRKLPRWQLRYSILLFIVISLHSLAIVSDIFKHITALLYEPVIRTKFMGKIVIFVYLTKYVSIIIQELIASLKYQKNFKITLDLFKIWWMQIMSQNLPELCFFHFHNYFSTSWLTQL